jgi:hypothetical protein
VAPFSVRVLNVYLGSFDTNMAALDSDYTGSMAAM